MKTVLLRLFQSFILSIITSFSFAQSGTLDSSFGVKGKVTSTFGLPSIDANNIAIQQDGKLLVIGSSFNSPTSSDFLIARYLSNGNLDSSFGINGKVITKFNFGIGEAYGTYVAIQNDGKIIAGGYLYETYIQPDHFALARYLPNGIPDSTFGVNGQVVTYLPGEDELTSLQIQNDGKILAGGYCDGFCVVRYKPNGSLDSVFGSNGTIIRHGGESVSDIQLQTDGKSIITGGNRIITEEGSSYSSFETCRLLANGSFDSTFGYNGFASTNFFGGYDEANSSVILKDGSIISAGFARNNSVVGDYIALVKYKNNGLRDSSFGVNGIITTKLNQTGVAAKRVFTQQDGKIIIRGQISSGYQIVARFKTNGLVDSTFGLNGQTIIDLGSGVYNTSGSLQSDGKIITVGGPSFSIARLKGDEPTIISIKKNISIIEGNTGTTPVLFKVVLSKPAITDVFVNYTTKNLNALAGSDYTATSGTLRIKAGKLTGNIIVNVTGDNTREPNERFALVLSNPVNALLGTLDSATCTIKNDDPGFAFNATSSENISEKNSSIQLYPNPVKDILTIEGLQVNEKIIISIIDEAGKTIAVNTTTASVFTQNIKQLSPGSYFIKIESDSKTETLKFIKQ